MSEQNGYEPLLTPREIAERLRVDVTTVRRWIKNGTLEAITLPHGNERTTYRIKQSVFEKVMGQEKIG